VICGSSIPAGNFLDFFPMIFCRNTASMFQSRYNVLLLFAHTRVFKILMIDSEINPLSSRYISGRIIGGGDTAGSPIQIRWIDKLIDRHSVYIWRIYVYLIFRTYVYIDRVYLF
jgi:hypothetical protein